VVTVVSGGYPVPLSSNTAEEISEVLVFSGDRSASLSKTPTGEVTLTVLGAFYDLAFNPKTPNMQVDKDTLVVQLSEPMYGAVTVTYTASYTLKEIAHNSTGDAVVFAVSPSSGLTATLTLPRRLAGSGVEPIRPEVVIDILFTGWGFLSGSSVPLAYSNIRAYTQFPPTLTTKAHSVALQPFSGTSTVTETLSYTSSYIVTVPKPATGIIFSGDSLLVGGKITTPRGAESGASYYLDHGKTTIDVGRWVGTDGTHEYDTTIQVSPEDFILYYGGLSYALPVTATLLLTFETTYYDFQIQFDMLQKPLRSTGVGVYDSFSGKAGTVILNPPSNKEAS